MIERARAKLPDDLSGRVDFVVADADRLPFADGSFDLVAQMRSRFRVDAGASATEPQTLARDEERASRAERAARLLRATR